MIFPQNLLSLLNFYNGLIKLEILELSLTPFPSATQPTFKIFLEFIYWISKYSLRTYYVLNPILYIRHVAVNETKQTLSSFLTPFLIILGLNYYSNLLSPCFVRWSQKPTYLQVFPLLSLLQPFFIFQGQCCYYTELDQVTIALCCLTASSLFPTHPIVVVLVTQLCPTLCDIMDYSTPGSSVHGIFQARILEWLVLRFFRGSSRPGTGP